MAEDEKEKKNSPVKLAVVMIVGAILLVAVSMGGVFFVMQSMGMGGGGEKAKVEASHANDPAIYYPIDPPFVVNFKDRGRTRFLQVSMEVMTRNPEVISAIEAHMPLIRNNILLVLSNHDAEALYSAEGKEMIRQQVMEELKTILVQEIGRVGEQVEGLYFTSFVTQ